jgi:hypothetical protein
MRRLRWLRVDVGADLKCVVSSLEELPRVGFKLAIWKSWDCSDLRVRVWSVEWRAGVDPILTLFVGVYRMPGVLPSRDETVIADGDAADVFGLVAASVSALQGCEFRLRR